MLYGKPCFGMDAELLPQFLAAPFLPWQNCVRGKLDCALGPLLLLPISGSGVSVACMAEFAFSIYVRVGPLNMSPPGCRQLV